MLRNRLFDLNESWHVYLLNREDEDEDEDKDEDEISVIKYIFERKRIMKIETRVKNYT